MDDEASGLYEEEAFAESDEESQEAETGDASLESGGGHSKSEGTAPGSGSARVDHLWPILDFQR